MPDIFVKKRPRQIEIQRQELCDKFYLELRNWYFWTTEKSRNPDYSLRLIIRLLLCFFLQDKGLVPKELFDENFINKNLQSGEEYRYYNAILRNLFFNCLNTPIKERTEFEHKKLIKNIRNIKDQFNKVPFLNGGLFYEIEGDEFPLSNDYFFSELQTRHILELDGDYKVAGIIRILSQYKYKLSVDDLVDSEYAQTVDPEFIGKVFESLLACIDADSKENRRKTTGSFYTPREIVDYMVNEALDSYLQNYSQNNLQNDSKDNLKNDSNNDSKKDLQNDSPNDSPNDSALLQCKILDPACGSGAFTCGVMNEIMRRIDPDKKLTQQERYHKKLEILQKVIYCVDIQSMAVQISSLRFFLALIQEIIPDKKKDNYGIEPLPNLETKFICANALVSLTKEKGKLQLQNIKTIVKQLQLTREQHLVANTPQDKKKLQEDDKNLRKLLSAAMEDAGELSHETAELLLKWSPYDQTKSTPFFDPHWMFGIEDGFDIVIGNPPYVFARNSKSKGISDDNKTYYYENYEIAEYQINLYPLFFERGTNLLAKNGYLIYITPNNWLTLNTNQKLRRFILEKSNITIVVFYKRIFANADVDPAIVLFQNTKSTGGKIKLAEWDKQCNIIGEIEKQKLLATKNCIINVEAVKENETFNILDKIENNSVPLSNIACVKSGLKAYETGTGKPQQTNKMKNNRVYHSKTRNDKNYIKYLDGKNVCRYFLGWSGEYLKYGKNLAAPRSNFDLFSTPRILVRQIPSPLPFCINACYTADILLNDLNSMNIIYIKVSPLYLLGILNSKIISYWFAHKFGKLQRGIFPQFKINELAQFPIKNITPKKQQPIIDLVNQILSSKTKNPTANTTKLESKIDRLVYELYELTEKDIKIIEG